MGGRRIGRVVNAAPTERKETKIKGSQVRPRPGQPLKNQG